MDETTVKYSLEAGAAGPAGKLELKRRYPTVAYLRARARRTCRGLPSSTWTAGRVPMAALRATGWHALDTVELIPRYGRTTELPPRDTELLGRPYAAPIAIAPMGGPAIVWPGADRYLAEVAQRARIPYPLSTVGGMTIEAAAKTAATFCGSSSIALPATDTESASIWCAAPMKREFTC